MFSSNLALIRKIVLVVALLLGAFLALGARSGMISPPDGLSTEAMITAGVMIIMATCWVLDVMPIAATSLIPLAAFPILGVQSGKLTAKAYSGHIIMLLMGGFFLAKGLERWQVPQRLAILVQRWAKGEPRRLLYGLMATAAFLSMWLSNTATTLVMVSVGLAAIQQAEADEKNDAKDVKNFRIALLLGIAYAANIGGLATPVGTAPNAIFLGLLEGVPGSPQISFLQWMILALPVVVVLLPVMALMLSRLLSPFPVDLSLGPVVVEKPVPLAEGGKRALIIFVFTAVLWVFRRDLNLEFIVIPGWASSLGLGKIVDDGTVAMLGAVLMFAMPAGSSVPESDGKIDDKDSKEGVRVLDWATANTIPWSLIVLFGGGMALADAFKVTGLSAFLGEKLVWLSGAPLVVIVLVLCLGMSLLTEVTSNTATTTLLLPVFAAAAIPLGLPAVLLMFPATLCASAAFILPVSTPPNAIAAGVGGIAVKDMARVGVFINLIAVVLITAVTLLWVASQLGL
ncbi:MAG: SLC13/DASS family transporter [Deltaproteobacteria bacterium]|nr:SLC13/DASS family transporter [Deltaproteobacteria bacterium]